MSRLQTIFSGYYAGFITPSNSSFLTNVQPWGFKLKWGSFCLFVSFCSTESTFPEVNLFMACCWGKKSATGKIYAWETHALAYCAVVLEPAYCVSQVKMPGNKFQVICVMLVEWYLCCRVAENTLWSEALHKYTSKTWNVETSLSVHLQAIYSWIKCFSVWTD